VWEGVYIGVGMGEGIRFMRSRCGEGIEFQGSHSRRG
jgi:hypothetical protein